MGFLDIGSIWLEDLDLVPEQFQNCSGESKDNADFNVCVSWHAQDYILLASLECSGF